MAAPELVGKASWRRWQGLGLQRSSELSDFRWGLWHLTDVGLNVGSTTYTSCVTLSNSLHLSEP